MPSSSPALASLLARALAASPEGGSETSARIAALESAGRVNELIDMLGQGNEPGALAPDSAWRWKDVLKEMGAKFE